MWETEHFIKMINLLHVGSKVILVVNAKDSNTINVKSGVRQGCPIAPLLYAINTEPFQHISSSGTLHKGSITLGVRSTISMYANDTTGFVNNHKDFCLFMLELHIYENTSESLVNYPKSSILFLGPKFDSSQLQVIERQNRQAPRLHDRHKGQQQPRPQEAVDKFINRCNFWSASSLSIHSRTAMIHIFAESTLEFTAPFHVYLPATRKVIKKAYWKAIYGKEKEMIQAYNKTINHTSKGGLGAFDIEVCMGAQLALWVPLAEEHSEEPWA
jgi:hypothetical protein